MNMDSQFDGLNFHTAKKGNFIKMCRIKGLLHDFLCDIGWYLTELMPDISRVSSRL